MTQQAVEARTIWLGTRQVAERYGRTPRAVVHWLRRGVLTPDGRRVVLRGARIGGRHMTQEAWLAEFFAALAEPGRIELPPVEPVDVQRERFRRERELALKRLRGER